MNLDQRLRVLIAGDSIVAGYPTASGFRKKLRESLPESVVEFVGPNVDAAGLRHGGYHGHPSKSLVKKLPELLADRPDIAIIMVGGNGIPDTTPEDVGQEVSALAKGLVDGGVRGVYVSKIADVSLFSEHVRAYNEQIALQCLLPNVHVIDIGGAVGPADRGSPYYADDCHPNELGYDRMADVPLAQVFGQTPQPITRVGASGESPTSLLQRADQELKSAYPEMTSEMRAVFIKSCHEITGLGQSGDWAPFGVASNNVGAIVYRPGHDATYFMGRDGVKYAKYPTLKEGLIAAVEAYEHIISPDVPERPSFRRPVLTRPYPEATANFNLHGGKPILRISVRGSSDAEPTGNPFSYANLGVLVIAGALFAGTLALRPGHNAPPSHR